MKTQRAAGQRPALPKRQSKARCAAGRPTRPRRQNEKRGGSERTRPFPVVPAAGRQLHGGKIRLAAGQRPALPKQQSKARCAAGRPTRPRRRNEKRDGSERIRPFPVVPAAGRQLRDEDPTGSRPAAGSTETAVKGQMCGWQASAAPAANEKRGGSARIRPFLVVPAAGRQLRDEDPTGSRPAAGSTETAVKGQMCGWQANAAPAAK